MGSIQAMPAAAQAPHIDGGLAAEPAPPPDAFYDHPANLADLAPGDIIRSRQVPVRMFQLLPVRVQAWQLLYRTTGPEGEPDATVTTVMIPEGPVKPRPLLSFQAATDSTLRICNPSYALVHGAPIDFSIPEGPLPFGLPGAEMIFAAAGLAEGWAVSMPDHGGTDARFLTPRQPGYAVLDGIRAVENFDPVGLAGTDTPVGLWGYSGGAIASSWTIEEQPTYAPELNLVGAAFGAPERGLDDSLRSVDGALLAGLAPLALGGISKDSPEFAAELAKYVTPEGAKRINATRQHCVGQNVLSNMWWRFDANFNAPMEEVLANPVIRREVDARGVSGRIPTTPTYVYNGVTEEVAPIVATDRLVNSYCEGGTSVTYRREQLPPQLPTQISTTHGVVIATGAPAAFHWLKQRLTSGEPAPTGCDIQTVPSTLATSEALAALPPFVGAALTAMVGFPIGSGR